VPRLAHDAARDDSRSHRSPKRWHSHSGRFCYVLDVFGENRPQLIRDGWQQRDGSRWGRRPRKIGHSVRLGRYAARTQRSRAPRLARTRSRRLRRSRCCRTRTRRRPQAMRCAVNSRVRGGRSRRISTSTSGARRGGGSRQVPPSRPGCLPRLWVEDRPRLGPHRTEREARRLGTKTRFRVGVHTPRLRDTPGGAVQEIARRGARRNYATAVTGSTAGRACHPSHPFPAGTAGAGP
jgi:hypothetical protein